MNKLPLIAATVGLMLAASVADASPDQRKDGGPTPAPRHQAQKPAKAARPAVGAKRAASRPAPRAKPARQAAAVNRTRKVTTTVRRNVTTNVRRKVDVTRYRRVVRAPRRFHASRPWVAPRGFAYRRFSLGERIPPVLLVSTFFLTDFALYGLEAPPPEYIWVRDGADAVLVDRYTGEVIQVQYDIFY